MLSVFKMKTAAERRLFGFLVTRGGIEPGPRISDSISEAYLETFLYSLENLWKYLDRIDVKNSALRCWVSIRQKHVLRLRTCRHRTKDRQVEYKIQVRPKCHHPLNEFGWEQLAL